MELILGFNHTILLASQNLHKCNEFSQLLPQIIPAQPFYCEENASSYLGNALLKARTVQRNQPGNWVLADDSGLEVCALKGAPGIYSARYGGESLTSAERCDLLIEELADTKQRTACFICCLVLLGPNHKETRKNKLSEQIYAAQASITGKISTELRSEQEQNFGYDPIFELPEFDGKTFAQLGPTIKQQISHRSLALSRLKNLLIISNKI